MAFLLEYGCLKAIRMQLRSLLSCCYATKDDKPSSSAEERVPFMSKEGENSTPKRQIHHRVKFERASTCASIPVTTNKDVVNFWIPDIHRLQPAQEEYFRNSNSSQSIPTLPSDNSSNVRRNTMPSRYSSSDEPGADPTKDGSSANFSVRREVCGNGEKLGELLYSVSAVKPSSKVDLYLDCVESLPSINSTSGLRVVIKNRSDNRIIKTIEETTLNRNSIPLDRHLLLAQDMELSIQLLDSACEDCHLSHGFLHIKCTPPSKEVSAQQRVPFTRASRTACGARILVTGEYNHAKQNLYVNICKLDLKSVSLDCKDKYIYVKATLYYKYKKIRSFKTPATLIQDTSTNSISINKQLCFTLASASLNEVILIIYLMERSVLRQDIVLGREMLGPYIENFDRSVTTWGRIVRSEFPVSHWCSV